MKVVITGSSNGIGLAAARKFLQCGHQVVGIDKAASSISDEENSLYHCNYTHIIADIAELDKSSLPEIRYVNILINNAGEQNSGRDIQTNLVGLMKCTEKYGLQPDIKSIVNLASVSAHNGAEFPEYVASKGGVLSYTVWTAKEIAQYGATCNSLSFGGVATELNASVMNDRSKWDEIMKMTPLSSWVTVKEAAEWIYFFAVVNKSCSGQDLVIDNLETLNHKFIW